ncbi:MAG: hypothetical protein ABIY48_05725 [Acidimicrobiales bacterium]
MRIVAAGFGVVALGALAVGWLQNPDHITSSEAVAAARGAYAAAGLRDAVVDGHPPAGVYTSSNGHERVPVWMTAAKVRGGTVELWLARADGESVYLDDRAPDGGSQLLTDTQFRRLANHYDNPAATRQIHRNLVLTLAAALIALLAVRLATAADRLRAALARRRSLRRIRAARTVRRAGEPVRPSAEPVRRAAEPTAPVVAESPRGRDLRLSRFARRRPLAAPAVTVRPPPRPGRPLRARQETS